MKKRMLVLAVVLVLVAAGAFAQTTAHTVTITIAKVGVIGLNDTTDITFTTSAPVLPGDPVQVTPASDASKRLYYTCVNDAGKTRHITVGSDIAIPAGTSLTVTPVTAGGAGTAVGAPVPIGTVAADLVTAIGSVATGRVAGTSGTGLTYNFALTGAAAVGTTVVTVTYTMTGDTY